MADSLSFQKKQLKDYRRLLGISSSEKIIVRRLLPESVVMLVSPHPDDEVLQATLALRLQRENSLHVVNVTATLGSHREHQKRRKGELEKAVQYLKFTNYILPEDWKKKKNSLNHLIKRYSPALIIAPHARDQHPTHIKTNELVRSCLKTYSGHVAWSEFWSPQQHPNLLVELPEQDYLRQFKALTMHKGEIKRNPYHLRLLAWHMDTVRRGSELLQMPGAKDAEMMIGQMYRLEKFIKGHAQKIEAKKFVRLNDDVSDWLR